MQTEPSLARSNVAWGAVRDALAAVHNLETLLKSPRVGAPVLSGLMPELFGSCAALRAAFAESTRELGAFASERLDALEQSMKEASREELDARARLSLEQVVTRVSRELGAAVDLLDLTERAGAPLTTEVRLDELARASLRIGSGVSQREDTPVRVDTHGADCAIVTDPQIVARLLAAALAHVRAAGAHEAVLRARCDAREVRLEVAPVDASSARLPASRAKLARSIAPAAAVALDAARAIGGRLAFGDAVVLTLPRG
jgi:hypothetical protein